MRLILSILTGMFVLLFSGCASSGRAVPETRALAFDFDGLVGPMWNGTLTYLDYTSGKSTTIRSTLRVEQLDAGAWRVAIGYNDEPHADGASELRIVDGGSALRFGEQVEKVILRQALPGGGIEIVTEYAGRDDEKPADIRRTYRIEERLVSIRKQVRFAAQASGAGEYITRHEYRWSR